MSTRRIITVTLHNRKYLHICLSVHGCHIYLFSITFHMYPFILFWKYKYTIVTVYNFHRKIMSKMFSSMESRLISRIGFAKCWCSRKQFRGPGVWEIIVVMFYESWDSLRC